MSPGGRTQIEARLRWAVVWSIRRGKAVRDHGYLSKADALDAARLRE